jgi:hypothetical protein
VKRANRMLKALYPLLSGLVLGCGSLLWSQGAPNSDADLIKELQNPVADLISVPIENRADFGGGKLQGFNMTFQPVLPFTLSNDLLLVSRTVVPLSYARGEPGTPSTTGIGDTLQSFFFAPKNTSEGLIYGAGPVFRLPTAAKGLGSDVWGAGPTLVVIKQGESWTYGVLANHIWSVAGRNGATMSGTYIQPTVAYTTQSLLTFGVSSEATYDWKARRWTVPIDGSFSTLAKVGNAPVNLSFGLRKYLNPREGDPTWGATFTITLMFPK